MLCDAERRLRSVVFGTMVAAVVEIVAVVLKVGFGIEMAPKTRWHRAHGAVQQEADQAT